MKTGKTFGVRGAVTFIRAVGDIGWISRGDPSAAQAVRAA